MAEYIEKQAAIDAVDSVPAADWVRKRYTGEVERIPPTDVRPVVQGRWLLDSDPGEPWKYKCNKCGEVTNNTCMGEPRYNYCPMCGADMMDGDADGNKKD